MLDAKKITLIFCFSLLLSLANGQTTASDSTIAIFLNNELPDRTRLDALIAYGEDSGVLSRYPDSILQYYQQAEPIIQKIGTTQDLMHRKLQLGAVYFLKGTYDKSLEYEEDAADMARVTKDTLSLVHALMRQGNVYYMKEWSDLAAEKYLEALQFAEQMDYQVGIRKCLGNLGSVFNILGEFDDALKYHFRALELEHGNILEEVQMFLRIGISFQGKGDFDKALEYFLKGIEKASESELIGDLTKANLFIYAGTCYRAKNKPDLLTAKKFLLKAIQLMQEHRLQGENILALQELGALYISISKPDSALYYLERSHDLAIEAGNIGLLVNTKQFLSTVYEERNDFEKALLKHKEFSTTLDSLEEIKNRAAIYRAEARYTYEKKKMEDQLVFEQSLAQQKLKSQRQLYLFLGGSILLIFFLLGWLKIRQTQIKQERLQLLYEVELWKERLANSLINSPKLPEVAQLDRERIEFYLNKKIGASSWQILTTIFENPSISNKDLAKQVYLSQDGLSSALRRMYKTFEVHTESNRNKKVALITKAVKLSLNQG